MRVKPKPTARVSAATLPTHTRAARKTANMATPKPARNNEKSNFKNRTRTTFERLKNFSRELFGESGG